MSTTVLESDSSTTTLNLTDGGGVSVGVGVAIGGVITNDNKTEPIKISSEPKRVDNSSTVSDIGPLSKKPKSRPTPYSKPILLTADRRQRKKKSITWRPDDSLKKIHYFEKIPDERVNVYKLNVQPQPETANASAQNAASSPNAHRVNPLRNDTVPAMDGRQTAHTPSNSQGLETVHAPVRLADWKLILIDFTPELPSPGWNSVERSAQAERETYVLGAIDLPGQPSTIDEPDNATGSEPTHSNEVKTIPLENPDGMYTEYPDMYNSEIVNGIRITNRSNLPPTASNTAVFIGQSSQLLPDQYQQQLINVVQNPFTFQEMSAQFQQQQPQPFPFAAQQQPQPFQTHFIAQQPQQIMQPSPFMSQQPQQQQPQPQQSQPQQQQQQPGVSGPITPWLNYPFNPISENSHALLFRRPAT